VVIAIIAILAAILFPVFAQAKEAAKKTAALSNTKQMGTAFNIYLSDSDDTFPLAYVMRPAPGAIGVGVGIPFPANNGLDNPAGVWETTPRVNMAACTWVNSVFPYVKSGPMYAFTSNPTGLMFTVASSGTGDTFLTGTGPAGPYQQPLDCTLTFNGDLHRMNASSVASPSIAVLAWPGEGKYNVHGRGVADPALNCNNTIEDCIFNPSGRPSAVNQACCAAGQGDIWYYGPVYNSYWVFSDKHMPSFEPTPRLSPSPPAARAPRTWPLRAARSSIRSLRSEPMAMPTCTAPLTTAIRT